MDGTRNPYEGKEPYIFVSYARKDADRVFMLLDALCAAGYRIWYDAGIHAGADWKSTLRTKVEECTVFLPILSEAFLESYYCFEETNLAEWHRKDIVPVYLEALDPERIPQFLRALQDLRLYQYDIPAFVLRCGEEPLFVSCHCAVPAPVGELLEELNCLCGLTGVKAYITSLIRMEENNAQRRKLGLPISPVKLHMMFVGSSGTGKTKVARLIGRIYQSIGLLPRGHFVEVSRSDLVAGYVGQTAIKTQEMIDHAKGGVLFIDEFDTLKGYSEYDFGQEAIDTLLYAMEDQRNELVVIAAGYTEPMKCFLQLNPGLQSRFNILFFPNYSLEELTGILDTFCRKYRYKLTLAAQDLARQEIARQMKKAGSQFDNGITVRNLFDRLVRKQAERISRMIIPSEEDMTTITEEDVENALHD